MSISGSSTQSLYHTDEAASNFNADRTQPIEDTINGVAFNIIRNPPTTSKSISPDQVRCDLKQVVSYIKIEVNGKSFRISVHGQNQQFFYKAEDLEKIAAVVKRLIASSNTQKDLSKGTLNLSNRTWTATFRNEANKLGTVVSTAQDSKKLEAIFKDLKKLFDEIKPIKALPLSKELETNPKRSASRSSLVDDPSTSSPPDNQTSAFRKKTSKEELFDQVSTKRRKSNSCISTEENPNLKTAEPDSKEKQSALTRIQGTLTKIQGWGSGLKDQFFPKKSADDLSHLDLSSEHPDIGEEDNVTEFDLHTDTTSSVGGSLYSEDIGASRTVLKDKTGFNL